MGKIKFWFFFLDLSPRKQIFWDSISRETCPLKDRSVIQKTDFLGFNFSGNLLLKDRSVFEKRKKSNFAVFQVLVASQGGHLKLAASQRKKSMLTKERVE